MNEDDDDEVARCYQCNWPLTNQEGWTLVIGQCPDCGGIHPIGAVHMYICAIDMAHGASRVDTQHKRLSALRMN